MFDKVKKADKYRRAQVEMKKELEQIFVQNEKQGISILMRGDKKVEKLEINGEEQKTLRDLINDTMKDVDKKAEKKMRGHMADLGLDL
ncbi:YbaB/EbfC family nucleoid-associated protein [Patescibacteria group bacterium]|nr:YbaB/EbfC family nucleoid-associated protein [Patescibacteria group bacterium]